MELDLCRDLFDADSLVFAGPNHQVYYSMVGERKLGKSVKQSGY